MTRTFHFPYNMVKLLIIMHSLSHATFMYVFSTTVSNFIYTLNEGQEGFASLTELACKGQGECYEDIKRAIDNCNENPTVEDCMNYPTCDCLMDFLSVIGTLSGDAKEAFLKLESSIGKMENSVTNCR